MNKLKLCSHCKGECEVIDRYANSGCWVECRKCSAKSGEYATHEEAIRAWNARALEEAKDKRIRELEEALNTLGNRAFERLNKEESYSRLYEKARDHYGISAAWMNAYTGGQRVQTGGMSVKRLIGEVMIRCMICEKDPNTWTEEEKSYFTCRKEQANKRVRKNSKGIT